MRRSPNAAAYNATFKVGDKRRTLTLTKHLGVDDRGFDAYHCECVCGRHHTRTTQELFPAFDKQGLAVVDCPCGSQLPFDEEAYNNGRLYAAYMWDKDHRG